MTDPISPKDTAVDAPKTRTRAPSLKEQLQTANQTIESLTEENKALSEKASKIKAIREELDMAAEQAAYHGKNILQQAGKIGRSIVAVAGFPVTSLLTRHYTPENERLVKSQDGNRSWKYALGSVAWGVAVWAGASGVQAAQEYKEDMAEAAFRSERDTRVTAAMNAFLYNQSPADEQNGMTEISMVADEVDYNDEQAQAKPLNQKVWTDDVTGRSYVFTRETTHRVFPVNKMRDEVTGTWKPASCEVQKVFAYASEYDGSVQTSGVDKNPEPVLVVENDNCHPATDAEIKTAEWKQLPLHSRTPPEFK